MSVKTKPKVTFSDMSQQDIVSMLVAQALTAAEDVKSIRVGHMGNSIVIHIPGWVMRDGNIVRAE